MHIGQFGLALTKTIGTSQIRAMAIDIGGMRKPYMDRKTVFDIKDLVSKEPLDQFKDWFEKAKECPQVFEANAMCLATATKEGFPSSRMVLLKEFGEDGFVFYTNYDSRKGQELRENPNASLMFYWEPLKRSIRIEGTVAKVTEEKSEAYFKSRPFESQIGAVVSDQSQVIESRHVLTDKEESLRKEYQLKGDTLKKPAQWGGYCVQPRVFEFWQGQSNRIHDRIRFKLGVQGWKIERLAP